MKFYIIKPKSASINKKIEKGVKEIHPEAELSDSLYDSEVVIMQKGWDLSRPAIMEWQEAQKLNKQIRMDYIYLDRYKVHLNKGGKHLDSSN